MAFPPSGVGTADLRGYLRAVWKGKWIIVSIFIITVATATIATFLQTPIYEATVKILIDREPPRIISVTEVQVLDTAASDYYATQYEMIKSRTVLKKVIQSLNLTKGIPAWAGTGDPIGAIADSIKVEPRRGTRIVDVKVQNPDPRLAAEIANAVGHSYARYTLDLRLTSTKEAVAWLSEQMGELKAKVQDSQMALQKYREKTGVLGIAEQRGVMAQKVTELNKASLEAQTQRLALEVRLRELSSLALGGTGPQGALILADNPLIQKLKMEASDLQVQLSKLLSVYKEKHPEVLKIRSQMDQVQERIKQEIQLVINNTRAEHKLAQEREAALLKRANDARREALDLNEKEIQYTALQQEAVSNQGLFDMVVKRLKEAGLSGGLETTNIKVVEEALVPNVPIKPRKGQNIALGIAAGLVMGLGCAFMLDFFDNTIKTPDEAERYLGLPTLGIVPFFTPKGGGTS